MQTKKLCIFSFAIEIQAQCTPQIYDFIHDLPKEIKIINTI